MKIYVASSWKNLLHPGIVFALRRCGHEVYDFRFPISGNSGFFNWKEVDPKWKGLPIEVEHYRKMLNHPIAEQGYQYNITALRSCDACVYVLPCGRSASWEFGYAMGQGKRGYVIQFSPEQPELMFREAKIIANMDELFDIFGEPIES